LYRVYVLLCNLENIHIISAVHVILIIGRIVWWANCQYCRTVFCFCGWHWTNHCDICCSTQHVTL